MVEEELLNRLKRNEDSAFKAVYKETYPMVLKYVRGNNGNHEDAEDIFQEMLIAFLKKLHTPGFELTSKLSTYLFSISKKLWLYRLRSKKTTSELEEAGDLQDNGADLILEKKTVDVQLDLIADAMSELKEDCRRLLIDFYYIKKSLKEIAGSMHVTDGFIRVKKGRCLEYFREIVKKHTLNQD